MLDMAALIDSLVNGSLLLPKGYKKASSSLVAHRQVDCCMLVAQAAYMVLVQDRLELERMLVHMILEDCRLVAVDMP